jgi:putative tricarboxylic transport membrane protein
VIRRTEGVLWTILGLSVCFLAWRTHFGSFREPGPGFVPFFSGLLIGGIGLVMILAVARATPSQSDTPGISFFPKNWRQLFFTMALLCGYTLLLDTLGYIITTLSMMWAFFYVSGGRRWVSSLFISSVIVASTYLVFDVWLRCQLPRGIFP